jgi:hypothetical protein
MTHYIVEYLKWDEERNWAYWEVEACYDKLESAVAYCADKDHDYYNIKAFQEDKLVQEYEPNGEIFEE